MKKFRFVFGLILGVFLSITIFFVISCKSKPDIEIPPSSTFLKDIDGTVNVKAYKLEVDNIQYIVVVNGTAGGVAITKHQ